MSILGFQFKLFFDGPLTSKLGTVRMIGEIIGGRGVEPKHALRTMDTYGITFILGGTGSYEGSGPHRYELLPGSLILTYPNRPHLFGPAKGQTWHEIFAIFEGPIFDLLAQTDILNPNRRVLQLQDPEVWAQRLRLLASSGEPVQVQTDLVAWLTQAVQAVAPRTGPDLAYDWFSRAVALLEGNLGEAITMESVADKAGVGYDTFRKEFVRLSGVSPMKFRTRRRLNLAAGLLHHTGLPMSEIALRLGYPDAFTFSKAFKRHYGLSPRIFRRAATGRSE